MISIPSILRLSWRQVHLALPLMVKSRREPRTPYFQVNRGQWMFIIQNRSPVLYWMFNWCQFALSSLAMLSVSRCAILLHAPPQWISLYTPVSVTVLCYFKPQLNVNNVDSGPSINYRFQESLQSDSNSRPTWLGFKMFSSCFPVVLANSLRNFLVYFL